MEFYLLSIGTVIRLVTAYMYTGFLLYALYVVSNSLNWVLVGEFSYGPLHAVTALILAPPILRLGVMAGGFTSPPLLHRARERTKPLQSE
jgi:hypothetical protein